MAVVLATALKVDGEFYEEDTPLRKLPNKARTAAKEAGILRQKLDQEDLEEAIAAEEELADEEEDEDEEDEDE